MCDFFDINRDGKFDIIDMLIIDEMTKDKDNPRGIFGLADPIEMDEDEKD